MVYQWLSAAQQCLFCPVCRLCRVECNGRIPLCPGCRDELPWLHRTCETCAMPLPETAQVRLCAACQQRRRPAALDGCRALLAYRAPVDEWVKSLKFHGDLGAARLLGAMLAEFLLDVPDALGKRILPVPLHPRRLRQRGYNQALELCRPLRRAGFVVDSGCCDRRHDTRPQSLTPSPQRHSNLRGAFRVRRPLVSGQWLLIDDVMTSGATLQELALTLKRAGATRVEACVIARSTPDRLQD